MPLTLDENPAHYQIRAFKAGMIQVNDEIYTHSIIISPDKLITNWEPQHIEELTRAHLAIIMEMRPAIFILGTGETLHFPSPSLYGDLINQGVGVEMMNTSAACRTYNALSAEGRRVVAAVMLG